jgi:hypothetical protein
MSKIQITHKRNLRAKVTEFVASWGLDFIKGFAIDSIAVGSAAFGPWLVSESGSRYINDHLIISIGGTYVIYLLVRFWGNREDIKLQNQTGITTNAWGKTAQTFAEWVAPTYFKSKDFTSHFQVGGELLKFLRDELLFLVPTIGYGVITNKVYESIFFLNVGTIVGYLIRIGIQENPWTQKLIRKFVQKKYSIV